MKKMLSKEMRNFLTGILFILPNFIGFLIFTLIPVIASLVLSFLKWDLINPPEFVGLNNFFYLIKEDQAFWAVLKNTGYYSLLVIPGTIIFSLILAVLLNAKLKGSVVFRFIYFLPVVTSTVAVSLVWSWIYNPSFGLLNNFLSKFGVPPVAWLSDPRTAMVAIAIVSIWTGAGNNMVLFLSGMQGIPEQLYEAAGLDGAGPFRKFFSITLPMLTPTTFFVLVMTTINSFQVFDLVYMMTGGGPNNSTRTIVSYIYETGFEFFNMGNASASAWILFAFIFILTLIQFKVQNKWVQYYDAS